MKELTHFIGGKHANGTSVHFCDGFCEVISRVPLASKAEVRAAVENAIAAQAAWAATNPQRRARVLMKSLELVARAWPVKSSSAR
jgi:malonate-semialdehyde dehydrogenase (acetylating) / methylmalonate-semialdehyde dehydrogenase